MLTVVLKARIGSPFQFASSLDPDGYRCASLLCTALLSRERVFCVGLRGFPRAARLGVCVPACSSTKLGDDYDPLTGSVRLRSGYDSDVERVSVGRVLALGDGPSWLVAPKILFRHVLRCRWFATAAQSPNAKGCDLPVCVPTRAYLLLCSWCCFAGLT